jgi:PAS domain-containing protein
MGSPTELFLCEILVKSKDILDDFHSNFLTEATELLWQTSFSFETLTATKTMSIWTELKASSKKIQEKLQENLSESAMLSLFNAAYHTCFESFHLLENFDCIHDLMPRKDANLSKSDNDHEYLRAQLATLEALNTKLSKEIFQKKQLQKELENNEKLYGAVIHNSLDANIIFNVDGIIIRANKKAAEFTNIHEN